VSYSLSVSGHVESKKEEAAVLAAAVELADKVEALGSFSFSGSHFSVWASAPQDAVAKAKDVLAAYNAEADADDQVASSVDGDAGDPDPEESEG
jgi:hypothetical protein